MFTPLHCFYSLFLSLFTSSKCTFFFYPVCHHNSLIVVTISHLTNMQNVVFPQIDPFRFARPLFRFLPLSHVPFFIASLLLFCCA